MLKARFRAMFSGSDSDLLLLNVFTVINATAKDNQLGVLYCNKTGSKQINIAMMHIVSM
jgi:hypothetical protein